MKYTAKTLKGRGEGRKIGFPTINLTIPETFNHDFGIYAAKVWLSGKSYAGALHFGPIPTYNLDTASLEIYLLDYNEKNQPESVDFEIVQKIRDIQEFSNPKELSEQIGRDVREVREVLKLNK